jgi:hypothetical protein
MNEFKFFSGILSKIEPFVRHGIIPNQFEPMRQNRYLVELPIQFEIPSYFITEANRPIFNTQTRCWESFQIKIITPISPSITERLLNIQNNYTYFTFQIKMLDPTGVVVEHWGIDVESYLIDYGNLNYNEDNILCATITINPSNCYLNP